jgi:hypothetical protein
MIKGRRVIKENLFVLTDSRWKFLDCTLLDTGVLEISDSKQKRSVDLKVT